MVLVGTDVHLVVVKTPVGTVIQIYKEARFMNYMNPQRYKNGDYVLNVYRIVKVLL